LFLIEDRVSVYSLFSYLLLFIFIQQPLKKQQHSHTLLSTTNDKRVLGCLGLPLGTMRTCACSLMLPIHDADRERRDGMGRMGRTDGKQCAYDIRSFRGNGCGCIEKNGMALKLDCMRFWWGQGRVLFLWLSIATAEIQMIPSL